MFALVLIFWGAALSQPIGQRIDDALTGERAFWGIQVLDLEADRVLYSRNADSFFVPASNTKLFTTALALMRLGPQYRFRTTVRAGGPPDESGRLAGDLVLAGGGDPLLSGRAVPYRKGPPIGDPLQAIEALAEQVAARGIRRIDGDIIGDDTAYLWAPYPEGWAQEDATWEYGAPVSALTVHDNTVSVRLVPNAKGSPALFLTPPLEYYIIDNRVRSGPFLERKVEVERHPGSRQLRLWGTLPADPAGVQLLLAIDDPALYAAHALADALTRRGIAIRGRPAARHRFQNEAAGSQRPEAFEVARRESPPLIEVLRIMNKESQNLHTELVLREVARERRGTGTREAGLEELRAFLAEAGIPEDDCEFLDGSGLSRRNLVTPAAVVGLLRYMHRMEYREEWLSLLPLGGEDGTLGDRFGGNPAARRVRAKTGTLSRVGALSGYADSPSRGRLAFSILANNDRAPSARTRAAIDRVALLLTE